MRINSHVKRKLKHFFRITLKKIGLENEAFSLAEWVCSQHMVELDLRALHMHLNTHEAFVQNNLWRDHRTLYHELGRKVMSSHNVLHAYRDVGDATKEVRNLIFARIAIFNNKDHNLIQR